MDMDEYTKLLRTVADANRAALSGPELAQQLAKENVLKHAMAAQVRRQQADEAAAAAAAEAERLRKLDEKRGEAERRHLEEVRLRFDGTEAAWRAIKDDVLQAYRQRLLGGTASDIAAKAASIDYGL